LYSPLLPSVRGALHAAYAAAGRTLPGYADPVIVPGQTVVKTVDISEIRTAVLAL
jgi:hypothetical protein